MSTDARYGFTSTDYLDAAELDDADQLAREASGFWVSTLWTPKPCACAQCRRSFPASFSLPEGMLRMSDGTALCLGCARERGAR